MVSYLAESAVVVFLVFDSLSVCCTNITDDFLIIIVTLRLMCLLQGKLGAEQSCDKVAIVKND